MTNIAKAFKWMHNTRRTFAVAYKCNRRLTALYSLKKFTYGSLKKQSWMERKGGGKAVKSFSAKGLSSDFCDKLKE